jgi:hypothetical protein
LVGRKRACCALGAQPRIGNGLRKKVASDDDRTIY